MRLGNAPSCLAVFATIVILAAPLPAQRQPAAPAGLGQNAALRYWQAFAHLPRFDDAQQKLLAGGADAANDPAAAKLTEEGVNALLYLHRGAAIGPCDWGLHWEDGPYLLLPQLSKGRDLARLA